MTPNLNESQGSIIYTLIHKNIQLKKQIQKLSSALYNVRQIQGMDLANTNPPSNFISNPDEMDEQQIQSSDQETPPFLMAGPAPMAGLNSIL